ncbi:MAG: GNAT family N-acetyltransferase [Alistipes sp.]|nr:GNAT family N-acetyltransferase [Alistipes sp.]
MTFQTTSTFALLMRELRHRRPLMLSHRGSLALYTFRGGESPQLMWEVGRLRERAFRAAGGGVGREVDIDADDIAADGYNQLIAWDLRREQIVGGYRYIVGRHGDERHISSLHYFRPSDKFRRLVLPSAIELGRSFVVRESAGEGVRHSLFAMDALWQALGLIVGRERGVRYLFGKVTIPPLYDALARELILRFLEKFHPARQSLLQPRWELEREPLPDMFTLRGYEENYALLQDLLRSRGERLPPMLQAYMRLSRQMQSFGAVLNTDFGHAIEVAILIDTAELNEEMKMKYTPKGCFASACYSRFGT